MVMFGMENIDEVGREFVFQYFAVLNKAPADLLKYYTSKSLFVHGNFGVSKSIKGRKKIRHQINDLNFRECVTKIKQVESQPSFRDCIVIQVSGEISNDGEPMRHFTQTFVVGIKPRRRFLVHNYIFRYQDTNDKEILPEMKSGKPVRKRKEIKSMVDEIDTNNLKQEDIIIKEDDLTFDDEELDNISYDDLKIGDLDNPSNIEVLISEGSNENQNIDVIDGKFRKDFEGNCIETESVLEDDDEDEDDDDHGDHVEEENEEESKCLSCGKTFESGVELKNHKCHLLTEKCCTVCDKLFKQNSLYLKHLRMHREKRSYKCKVCSKNFQRMTSLKRHVSVHMSVLPYNCDKCGKKFRYKSSLDRHSKGHIGIRPFTCSICSKSFIERSNLLAHLPTHNDENPFKCKSCGLIFSEDNILHQHIKKIHSQEPGFFCELCGKSYSNEMALQYHVSTHEEGGELVCDLCGKTLNSKSGLKRHKMSHTGAKEFRCTQCDKSFIFKNSLMNHMKLHTGDKPFLCAQCGKSFSTHDNIKSHMRFHAAVRPYICTVCNKGFFTAYHLKDHVRDRHTEERPVLCDLCGKSFKRKYHLNKHLIDQHFGRKEFGCPTCGLCFSTVIKLRTHIKTHGIDIKPHGIDASLAMSWVPQASMQLNQIAPVWGYREQQPSHFYFKDEKSLTE